MADRICYVFPTNLAGSHKDVIQSSSRSCFLQDAPFYLHLYLLCYMAIQIICITIYRVVTPSCSLSLKKILLVEYAFPKRSLHKLRRGITGPVFQLSCSYCWKRKGYKLSALIPLQFISYLYEPVVYSSTTHLHQPLSVLVISSGCPSAFQVGYFVFHFERYSRQVNKLINTKLSEDYHFLQTRCFMICSQQELQQKWSAVLHTGVKAFESVSLYDNKDFTSVDVHFLLLKIRYMWTMRFEPAFLINSRTIWCWQFTVYTTSSTNSEFNHTSLSSERAIKRLEFFFHTQKTSGVITAPQFFKGPLYVFRK